MNRSDEDKAMNENEAAANPALASKDATFLVHSAGRHRHTLGDGWWCAHLEVIGAGDEGRFHKSPQVERFPFVQISDSHIGFNKEQTRM